MSLQDQLKQFRKSLDGQYSGQLPKAATHIEQDLLAIIGEDEEDMLASPDGGKYKAWRVTYRNNMRKEAAIITPNSN